METSTDISVVVAKLFLTSEIKVISDKYLKAGTMIVSLDVYDYIKDSITKGLSQ